MDEAAPEARPVIPCLVAAGGPVLVQVGVLWFMLCLVRALQVVVGGQEGERGRAVGRLGGWAGDDARLWEEKDCLACRDARNQRGTEMRERAREGWPGKRLSMQPPEPSQAQ